MRPRRWATLLLAASTGAVLAAGSLRAAERTLLLVLDAVPYETMVRLTSGDGVSAPLFADFEPPVPLISTFPSSTSIALAGILGDLGLERSPGYEARFFDWEERRRRGGGPLSYFQITFPWREFFDWNRKGPLRNALHAAWPIRAGIREVGRAMAAFRRSPAPTFTIYVADTDTAAHLFGPQGLDAILEELDAQLAQAAGTRVVLLSDHGLAGGEPLVNVLPAVRRVLEEGEWRWAERLVDPRDVVLTPYGLVSSFEAYCAAQVTPALARALASVAGVDFCVSSLASGWRVESTHASIDFERREGPRGAEWRWTQSGAGDGLAAVLAGVSAPGRWLPDAAVLAATATSPYPDPLYRLAAAFRAVENPASVICSLAPGYMFGARGTERSARWTKGKLRWTHGALGRDASLGFLMTNRAVASAPAAIRFDHALDFAFEVEPMHGTHE